MSRQKLSLQEQLLKSGLVSTAKAKTAQADKRKQTQKQRKNNVSVVDEAKELAAKAQAEKAAKDRELNERRKQQEAQRELAAQIRQLVEPNRVPQDDDGVAFRFTDQNRIKTVYVSDAMREQLIAGRLAIVKLGKRYEIITAEAAHKVGERDATRLIVFNKPAPAADSNKAGDDPYAAYVVPDDLVW